MILNEYGETLCPECNEDCFEFEEMTEDEEREKKNFFQNQFIVCPDKSSDDNYENRCLWDDWDLLKEFLEKRKDIFFYTLLSCEEDTIYISKGYHFVNRLGYYLSYNDIPMDNDIRYC